MRNRTDSQEEINRIYGSRVVIEAIKAGKTIINIYVQNQIQNPLMEELKSLAREHQIPLHKKQREFFDRYRNLNHQGVVAELSNFEFSSLDSIIQSCFNQGIEPVVLILDHITDVRNFGAICRTAEVAAVNAIIVPSQGGAPVNEMAIKTSAGALNYIPVCRSRSLIESLVFLKESGLRILAATEKGKKSVFQTDLTGPVGIIMGNEESGISSPILKYADEKLYIPQYGNIESLNVSVSAGIIIYECLRQRKFNPL